MAAPGAVGLQSFIDSTSGTVVGTTLHTVGAIAMLGAVAGYMAWMRQVRQGDRATPVLQASAVLAYLAIVMNLVGGFMRTYQSDHPSLTLLADNRWVQVLVVKHVALFAGMGALVLLFERVAPRVLRALTEGRPPVWGGNRSALAVAVAAIVVGAVFGAMMQVTPIGEDDQVVPEAPFAGRSYHYEGQLAGTPLSGGSASGTFEVAPGASDAQFVLQWSPAVFDLVLELEAPDGSLASASGSEGRAEHTVADPLAGAWTYTVRSDAAVGVAWSLDIMLRGGMSVVEETVTIPAGAFYEVNTEMRQGASFSWHWSAGHDVYFDVHSHFDGQVQVHVEKTAREDEGSFTNDRAGGYSLLWANEGNTPVRVTVHVEGAFDLHSIYRP